MGSITYDKAFYPAEFPTDVPTIKLKTIGISDLFEANTQTSKDLFDTLTKEGFFYLDLNTDQRGREFKQAAEDLHNTAKHAFATVPLTEKEKYQGDPLKNFDTGYRALGKNEQGEPTVAEAFNVPCNELLNDPDYELPQWLSPSKPTYKTFALTSTQIGQALLAALEPALHLAPNTLRSMHTLGPQTGGFVRSFRYPPNPPNSILSPPHTDGNAITILFNWQGGLQIARPSETSGHVEMIDTSHAKDDWLYVKPIPGHALVNLGDPMVVFSNGILKSGRHRVVTPPGEQAKFDRYSVLTGIRPRDDTPMRALKSDLIPEETEEQKAQKTVTSVDYTRAKVQAILQKSDDFKGKLQKI